MKSNYKIIILSFLIMSISLMSIVSVSAVLNPDTAYLNVVAEKISPDPVEPGQDFTIKLRITNDGGETASNVSLNLNSGYPFYIKTDMDNFKNIESLCSGCSIENTYFVVADADAKSGVYSLSYEISYDNNIIVKPAKTIDIKIIGKPDLVLETGQLEQNISSGDEFSVRFHLRNIGTGTARRIKVLPQSEDILMLGSNINIVNEIKPGDNNVFNLPFIVREDLKPDTYKFPVVVEFLDEQGIAHTDSFEIGVNILERSEIDIQSLKITPSYPTLVDKVHMEGILENVGTGDANKVVVQLITSSGKSYRAFVGQLKSDDDVPFYFDLKPDAAGVQTATLKITYDDDFGTHSFETEITKEVKRPTNNLLTAGIILLIVLLITGYFYFQKKKVKK